MDKCDFELLLRRPLREIQGRLLSLMHAGRIPHFLHFALGGPVTDEATYHAQHGKNLHALENGFYEPLPPVFSTQETAFSVLPPAQSSAWLRDTLALGLSIAPIQAYIRKRVVPFLLSTRTAPAQARTLFEHLLQRQEADYASRADADVYARMRCAASLESLLDVYLERLEALSVKQSGYGYLVDEAIRCMEERLHKNSLSLQEVSDYVFVFFIQFPRFRVFDQRRLGLDSVFILSNHGKNVKSSIVNLCISIRILTKKAAE